MCRRYILWDWPIIAAVSSKSGELPKMGNLTPELTRAEHKAFNMISIDNHERDAIEASG